MLVGTFAKADSVSVILQVRVLMLVAARGVSSAATKLARGVQWVAVMVGLPAAMKAVASAVALAGVWDTMSDAE